MAANLPTPEITLEGIGKALDAKTVSLVNLNAAQTKVYEAKKAMEDARGAILRQYNDRSVHPDGLKELGSNAENRKAALDEMTQKECFELQQAEFNLTKAQGDVNLSCIEVDRWRYTLRLLEVAAGITAQNAIR